LADLLPQIIFEAGPDGNFTYANRHAYDVFGYAPEDLDRGLNLMRMIVPGDIARARLAMSRSYDYPTFKQGPLFQGHALIMDELLQKRESSHGTIGRCSGNAIWLH